MSAPKILSHNPLYRRIASLFLVVFIAIWSAGTTNIFAQSNYCNAIFVVSNFLNQAVNVQRLTITPYMPGPSYNGAFLSPTIPPYTRANSPSLTNGTLTVSNLIMDYAYTVQITDNYTNSKSQIFLDSRLIGTNGNTVYAANYTSQNGNPNGPYAIPYLPWFSSTVISNITYTTGGGTTYSNSTDSAGVVSGSTIGTNLTEYATLTGATNIAAEQVAPWTNQVTPSAISDAGGITNYQTSPIFTSAIKITNSTSGNSTTYGQSGGKMQMQIFGMEELEQCL